jgi:hypothetical protein
MKKNNNNKNKNKRKKNTNSVSLVSVYGSMRHMRAPFGTWKRVKMEFVQLFVPTILGGTTFENIFRANSVFDPDFTGTGLQPRFFDQLTPVYNRYRVVSFSWHVEFANSSQTYPCTAGAVNGSQAPTSISDAAEILHSSVQLVGLGAQSKIFNGKVRLDQLSGRSFQGYHIDDLTQSVVTTNPIEVLNFHVVASNVTLTTFVPVISVTLWYDTVFFDPVIPAQS